MANILNVPSLARIYCMLHSRARSLPRPLVRSISDLSKYIRAPRSQFSIMVCISLSLLFRFVWLVVLFCFCVFFFDLAALLILCFFLIVLLIFSSFFMGFVHLLFCSPFTTFAISNWRFSVSVCVCVIFWYCFNALFFRCCSQNTLFFLCFSTFSCVIIGKLEMCQDWTQSKKKSSSRKETIRAEEENKRNVVSDKHIVWWFSARWRTIVFDGSVLNLILAIKNRIFARISTRSSFFRFFFIFILVNPLCFCWHWTRCWIFCFFFVRCVSIMIWLCVTNRLNYKCRCLSGSGNRVQWQQCLDKTWLNRR